MSGFRVIPALLLSGHRMVKTRLFTEPRYLGDPRNVVRIFNGKEVDEIILLDIDATTLGRGPDLPLIREIVSEAFMPVAAGGGIRDVATAAALVQAGVEKVVVQTALVEAPDAVEAIALALGSSAVVACIDVRATPSGHRICTRRGREVPGEPIEPVAFAKRCVELGAGEIVVHSVDRDGTMQGYDLPLLKAIAGSVPVPVIALGGAGSVADLQSVRETGAQAAAAGSLFVFYGRKDAVLIGYPDREAFERAQELPRGRLSVPVGKV